MKSIVIVILVMIGAGYLLHELGSKTAHKQGQQAAPSPTPLEALNEGMLPVFFLAVAVVIVVLLLKLIAAVV